MEFASSAPLPTSHVGLEVFSTSTMVDKIERKTYTWTAEFHPYSLAALPQVNPETRKQA